MTFMKELIGHLLLDPDLQHLVGDRIYPNFAKPNTPLPRIIVERGGTTPERHLLGRTGLTATRFEVHVLAEQQGDRDRISEVVRQLLDGHRGDLNDVDVRHIGLDDTPDTVLETGDGKDRPTLLTSQVYTAWHREP